VRAALAGGRGAEWYAPLKTVENISRRKTMSLRGAANCGQELNNKFWGCRLGAN